MLAFLLRRLLSLIPSILILLLFVVVLLRLLPGDVVDVMLKDFRASDLDRQVLEERLGIGDPIAVEYVDYVRGAATGDLGRSFWTQEPVLTVIFDHVSVTMELMLLALVFGTLTGIPLGVLSAVKQDTIADYALRSVSVLALSVPNFLLATAIVTLPAAYFGWSPPLFYTRFSDDPWAHFQHFLIPAAMLAPFLSASLMRMTRSMMLEVLNEDYVRTARAKGLPERLVVYRHSVKNALIPVVTLLGLHVAVLLSGAVVVEIIFGLPGLGKLLIDSLVQRDYPVIQGIAVVTGIFVMLTNLIVDASYRFLDPRIRLG